jgi:ubiquinone/menaquinone biosynthesis C-methylase UbiE
MSSTPEQKFNVTEHDWHGAEYVDAWIKRDRTRDERLPVLKDMATYAPFPPGSEITVLDVGAGYGAVAIHILERYPKAKVTLHDFSQVMLDRAKAELPQYAGQLSFRQSDLTDPNWTNNLGGPFDLVVSGIAIHNLFDNAQISEVYKGIYGLLKPGGAFLDCDHFKRVGGVNAHLELMKQAGFKTADKKWEHDNNTAVVVAIK